ncbi:hypothetical protein BURMUCF1_A0743 [Burkholderia multivorans ATCC BAA-247]|nr:hypothetical protein BURMUCF1_A0743 [Burkholderia multivorans ATCC BAA-247]
MHSGRGADARRRRIGLFCLGGQLRSHASGAWIRNGEYTKTTLQNLSVWAGGRVVSHAARSSGPHTSNMRTERMIAGIGRVVSSDESYARDRGAIGAGAAC